MLRVEVPRDTSELIALAKRIQEHHHALGAASPLAGMPRWDQREICITAAEEQDDKAHNLAHGVEVAHNLRDLEVDRADTGVLPTVQQAAEILANAYANDPAKLSQFGFLVEDAAATA